MATSAIECIGCGVSDKGAFCPECATTFESDERSYESTGPVSAADIVDDLMERLAAAARSDAQEGTAP
jgi:hypothetical protein